MDFEVTKILSSKRVGHAIEALVAGHINGEQFAKRLGLNPVEMIWLLNTHYHGIINGPTITITLQSNI